MVSAITISAERIVGFMDFLSSWGSHKQAPVINALAPSQAPNNLLYARAKKCKSLALKFCGSAVEGLL